MGIRKESKQGFSVITQIEYPIIIPSGQRLPTRNLYTSESRKYLNKRLRKGYPKQKYMRTNCNQLLEQVKLGNIRQ